MGVNAIKTIFGNKIYDTLKWTTQVVLPAIGTLYFALAGIWDFPNAEQVVGTIVAVVTFLGIVLGVSSINYQKSDARFSGDMQVIDTGDGAKTYSLDLNEAPESLEERSEVVFKVQGGRHAK